MNPRKSRVINCHPDFGSWSELEPLLDHTGYPAPGMHLVTLADIEAELVTNINNCPRRIQLLHGLKQMNDYFLSLDLHVEQWIGGSFASDENDPTDIDIVNIFFQHEVMAIPANEQQAFIYYVSKEQTARRCGCDSRIIINNTRDKENNSDDLARVKNFWERRLGHTWLAEPRGVLVHELAPTPKVTNQPAAAS